MTEKVFIFTFSVKGVSDQQAAELLGQIAEWAAMHNASLNANFVQRVVPDTVVAAYFLDP